MSQQNAIPTTQTPSVGRIVHYCLGEEAGSRKGEVRPAVVVAMRHPEMPNLQVLLDGPKRCLRELHPRPHHVARERALRWPGPARLLVLAAAGVTSLPS
ncbi:hypothetical protein ACN28E_25030 [Archangium lansingense]|uniref:hypothetical protein n=1 Tax=Archangium lansingense TaxID=2995310 RepID=UPI003B79461D